MADTFSSDGKKVVQALYDAIAAGDVERFFGAMHPQFQAELPGYLPWGKIGSARCELELKSKRPDQGKRQDENSAG